MDDHRPTPPAAARAAKQRMQTGCKLLQAGDFASGWEAYEARHDTCIDRSRFRAPRWRGEDLRGKRLFLWREQGVGDEVWFASCIPDLIERGAELELVCDHRLARLFRRSFPGVTVYPEPLRTWKVDDWAEVEADYQCAIGDLGRYLRASRAAFPERRGYLVPDPGARELWRERLARLGAGLKVGISWQGGPDLERLRHCPWDAWGEILGCPGVRFVSLQYGAGAAAVDAFRNLWGADVTVFEDLDAMRELDSVCALASALDVVLCVPNTVFHLAASVGAEAWLLYEHAWTCFWVTRGEEVPWYPGSRVLLRERDEPWSECARRVRAMLAARALDRQTPPAAASGGATPGSPDAAASQASR